ncbi:VgrG-related protein [Frankia sp. AgKG'84/4]|uniref:VgrG-related protein n=1 Tax=Frankia sp. AgKG'84/4 TaxID=573490 RepID=UPI00200F57F2|nr:VgrG-related protein [Frankia sp. AgKG'84/4]MCL9795934.1 VgrG-related protein [Frankia sp. AgKG'84/4]
MSTGTISNLPLIQIGGKPLPEQLAEALDECWVELSVNLPAMFHLALRDADHQLLRTFPQLKMGARVSIAAVADGVGFSPPLVSGLVTGLESDFDGAATTTVVRGLDFAFRLMRQRRAEGYHNATASSIARLLARRAGVTVGRIEETSTVYEVATQPNISDWEFLQHLADENGVAAYFDSLGKFQFRKPSPATGGGPGGRPTTPRAQDNPYVLRFGVNVLRCRSGITAADQVSRVEARGWDVRNKRPLTASAAASEYPGIRIGTSPARVVGEFGRAELVDTATPHATHAAVRAAAHSLAEDVTSAFAELDVAVRGEPKLRPGSPVTLEQAGPPFDGTYTATGVRHVFTRRRYETWVSMTGRQVRSLYGLTGGEAATGMRVPGVVNALVTDVRDPLQQGRVKLRFPWFNDTYTTDWVRSLQLGGGTPGTPRAGASATGSPGGGGVFGAEVGDEVLVAFDRGSMDHPYVLGGLYNGRNAPSKHDVRLVGADGRLNRRSLASRTGQRLELLDATAARTTGVRLRSGDGKLTVFLDETHTTISIDSKGKVEIHGRTDVSVHAGDTLTLSGRAVRIEATAGVSVTGGQVSVASRGPLGLRAAELSVQAGTSTVSAGTTTVTGAVIIEGAENVNGPLTVFGIPVPVPAP